MAAPLGGLLVKRIPAKWLLAMIGGVVLISSIFSIVKSLTN